MRGASELTHRVEPIVSAHLDLLHETARSDALATLRAFGTRLGWVSALTQLGHGDEVIRQIHHLEAAMPRLAAGTTRSRSCPFRFTIHQLAHADYLHAAELLERRLRPRIAE